MCNLGIAYPNKDDHVYFEHVVDDMPKILSDDELVDVVIDQVAEEVKEQNGIDSKIEVEIEMITNQISGETREAVNEEGIGQVSSIEELIQMCDNLNQVSIDAQEHEVVANGDLKKVTKIDDGIVSENVNAPVTENGDAQWV